MRKSESPLNALSCGKGRIGSHKSLTPDTIITKDFMGFSRERERERESTNVKSEYQCKYVYNNYYSFIFIENAHKSVSCRPLFVYS